MTARLPRLPRNPPTPRELGELAQLLFEWPIRRAPRLALPLCIIAAAMIQTGVVVLFSIRYGVQEQKTPTQPRFYFLPPDSPLAKKIEPWLNAHDPSVFSPLRATEMAVPAPPPLKYRPSYEDMPPPLKQLPPDADTDHGPPDLPLTGETQHSPSTPSPTPAAPPAPVATTSAVRWMDGLSALSVVGETNPPNPPTSTSAPIPRPSLYQVAVSPEGMPLSCVLTESSGNSSADEGGRAWILSRRFAATESQADSKTNGISWGRVEVVWGNTPAQKPASPTPAP